MKGTTNSANTSSNRGRKCMAKNTKKKALKSECFQTLNTDTSHLHHAYSLLDKQQSEITNSEYVYSLIEHLNNPKKFRYIKNEMHKAEHNKDRDNYSSTQFYIPNKNIYNFKSYQKNRNIFNTNPEVEMLDTILYKIEDIYAKRIYKQLQPKVIKSEPFRFSTLSSRRCNTEITDYEDGDGNNNKRKGFLYRNKLPHCNYFKYTLNEQLFNILQHAECKQSEFRQTKENIAKDIKTKYKMNLKEYFKNPKVNSPVAYKNNRYNDGNVGCSKYKTNYNEQKNKSVLCKKETMFYKMNGKYKLPIINKVLNVDAEEGNPIDFAKGKFHSFYKENKRRVKLGMPQLELFPKSKGDLNEDEIDLSE